MTDTDPLTVPFGPVHPDDQADIELIAAAPTLIADLLTERDTLARWKAEAIEVDDRWREVWKALGKPGRLGESIADASAAEVRRIRADLTRLLDAIGNPEKAEEMRRRHNRDHCYVGNHDWMQDFVRRVADAAAAVTTPTTNPHTNGDDQ